MVPFMMVFASAGCHGQVPSTSVEAVIAHSVTEFSGEQGKHGWQYGYWDRSADDDGAYQPSDFRLLHHFGKDVRNGLREHDAFTTGDLWFLEDGRYYTSLWATGGHANSPQPLGTYAAAEQWAVRRWTSDTSGPVVIVGHVGKDMPWGANWGGACQAIIMVDGETVLSTIMDEHGSDYSVAVDLHERSVVDFLIAPAPSIGVVTFTATIRERKEDP